MNWGMKIVVGLGAFMVFIVCAVLYMVNKNTDTLIDEDYYEKGLVYDEIYDRKQNLRDDHAKPSVILQNDTLVIVFVSEGNKGDLNFVRSSNADLDIVIPLYTNTNSFKLPINTFEKGSWLLEINWEHGKRKYIDTQSIFIN